MWKDSPDLIARASSLYAERIRTGAVKCTCGALADHTARYHGHAPGCEIETGWPDTLEALRDADFNADLETALEALKADLETALEALKADLILEELEP